MIYEKLEKQINELSKKIANEKKSLRELSRNIVSEKKSLDMLTDSYNKLKENIAVRHLENILARNPDIVIENTMDVGSDLFVSIGRALVKYAEALYLTSYTKYWDRHISEKRNTNHVLWVGRPEISPINGLPEGELSVVGMNSPYEGDLLEYSRIAMCDRLKVPKPEAEKTWGGSKWGYKSKIYKIK